MIKKKWAFTALCLASLLQLNRAEAVLNCGFFGKDKGVEEWLDVEVNFALRGYLSYKEGETKLDEFGSFFQLASGGESAKGGSMLVASGYGIKLKTYSPINENYRKYLGGDGYTIPLNYFRVTGRDFESDGPYSVNLYLAKNPNSLADRGGATQFPALLAVQYYEQTQPSYIRIICTDNTR